MFDYNRGAKAGGVAGLIIGVINVIISLIIILFFEDFFSIASSSVLGETVFISVILAMIFSGILGGIVAGGILGIIYAAVYNKLPGSTSVAKGLMFAIIYWILLGIGLGYLRISDYGMTYYIVYNVIVAFLTSMFWGFLVGRLWDRYGRGKDQPLI